jgi:hypothetical protein
LAYQRMGHHFGRMDRRRSLSVVAARLCRKGRSHMVLVEEAAVLHMGPLAVVCVVHILLDHSSHPVVHEEIAHDCSHADCNHEEVVHEYGRSSHRHQGLHIGREVESVDDSSCQRGARPGSVGRSA